MRARESPRLLIGLLGPLEVTIDGATIDLGGGRQRAVFAALALEPNRVVSLSTIVDSVWGDDPPASAKSTVQAYVSRLRRVVEPSGGAVIEGSSVGYALRVAAATLDLERFAEFVDDGRRARRRALPPSRRSASPRRSILLAGRTARRPGRTMRSPTPTRARSRTRSARRHGRVDRRRGRRRADTTRWSPTSKRLRGPVAVPRTVLAPADDRPVPSRSTGRRARRLPVGPCGAARGAGHRTGSGAGRDRDGDPAPGPRARCRARAALAAGSSLASPATIAARRDGLDRPRARVGPLDRPARSVLDSGRIRRCVRPGGHRQDRAADGVRRTRPDP